MVKIIVTIEETPTGTHTSVGGEAGHDSTLGEAVFAAALKMKIGGIVEAGPLALLTDSECMGIMLEKLNDLKKNAANTTQDNGENN